MISVQSSIRAEVSRGSFPSLAPEGAYSEAFSAFAIAAAKGLIPEMEDAAYLTLIHPMTFESLGEALRLFQGWALRDLANFRKRYIDNAITCLDSFRSVQTPGPSSIWVGCPEVMPTMDPSETYQQRRVLPMWLYMFFLQNRNNWEYRNFTHPLPPLGPPGSRSGVHLTYVRALGTHIGCQFCSGVDEMHGLSYCAELESKLEEARKKVFQPLYVSVLRTEINTIY